MLAGHMVRRSRRDRRDRRCDGNRSSGPRQTSRRCHGRRGSGAPWTHRNAREAPRQAREVTCGAGSAATTGATRCSDRRSKDRGDEDVDQHEQDDSTDQHSERAAASTAASPSAEPAVAHRLPRRKTPPLRAGLGGSPKAVQRALSAAYDDRGTPSSCRCRGRRVSGTPWTHRSAGRARRQGESSATLDLPLSRSR